MNRAARIKAYVDAVRSAVGAVPDDVHRAFVRELLEARQIVTAGRGRSGMMATAFARRLGQMGLTAWGLDDSTVPRLGPGDALVACTGSGETPTVLSLMDTARSGGARVGQCGRCGTPIVRSPASGVRRCLVPRRRVARQLAGRISFIRARRC